MSMTHVSTEIIRHTETGISPSPWLTLAVFGGGLLLGHAVRALLTNDAGAARWMRQRGLATDPRGVEATRQYLSRLRWSRVLTAGLLIVSCVLAAVFIGSWVSFVSLPFLLSVLVAETLAPAPRRGRVRTAVLQRRPRSYFAHRWPLLCARVAIGLGVLVSLSAVLHGTWPSGRAALHSVVMLTGGLALEACLAAVSLRPLPDREPDLSLDTAMRVASARTATAAALVFGTIGLVFAASFTQVGFRSSPSVVSYLVGQLINVSLFAAVITALVLLQPLRSWRPRESS